jgi:hypothetical protein
MNMTRYVLMSFSILALSRATSTAQESKADSLVLVNAAAASEEDFLETDEPDHLWFGLGIGGAFLRSRELYGLDEVMIGCGAPLGESSWLQFNASYSHFPLERTSDPEYTIRSGVSLAEIEAQVRYYTPPAFPFLGQYFSLGVGLVGGFWDYNEPGAFAGAARNSFDYLTGYDIHVGTGFTFGFSLPLSLNLDVTPGIILWSSGTEQGYSRAILPTVLYVKARVSLNYAVPIW